MTTLQAQPNEHQDSFLEKVAQIPRDRKGSQEPTTKVVNEKSFSVLDTALFQGILSSWGINLLPWQFLVLREMLATESSDSMIPAYKNFGLSAPRQQGKSEILIAYILIRIIYFRESVIYTSYREASALAIYDRMLDRIENNEILRDSFGILPSRNTKQVLKDIQAVAHSGEQLGKVSFSTRKGGGGRGSGYNTVLFDEAQDLTSGEYDAFGATTFARLDGQLIYFGTPPSFEDSATRGMSSDKSDRGRYFQGIRRRIVSGELPFSAWLEWGVDKLTPRTDIDAWYRVMPSLGYVFGDGLGLTAQHVASVTGTEESFNTEYLGYWASQSKERAIDITLWNDLKTKNPRLVNKQTVINANTPVAVSVKSSFDEKKIYLVVASRRQDDSVFIEVRNIWKTDAPWTDELAQEVKKWAKNRKTSVVHIDGEIVKASLKQKLQQLRLWRSNGSQTRQNKIIMTSSNDLAAASSSFLTLIKEKRIAHIGQVQLDAAVEDSRKRLFGRSTDRYGFASMSGLTDVTPVEAAAIASNAVLQTSKLKTGDITDEQEVSIGSQKATVKSGFAGMSL